MGRILMTLTLAGVLTVIAGWYFGAFTQALDDPHNAAANSPAAIELEQLGEPLYPAAALPRRGLRHTVAGGRDSIVITGNLRAIDRVDVPSQVPGQLLYVGDGVPEGVTEVVGIAPFMHDSYKQARVVHKDRYVVKFYRPLKEGEMVTRGQVVAEVDYSRALNAVIGHKAILERAKIEIETSAEMVKAAGALHNMTMKAPGSSANRDIIESQYTLTRAMSDKVKAETEYDKELAELYSAQNILAFHTLRFELPVARGYIQTIYHNTQEAVKDNEPVLQIYSTDRLLAEAFVESQYESYLRRHMRATVEPAEDEKPLRLFEGHRALAAINGVGFVVHGKTLYVVSAGDDGFLKMWRQDIKGEVANAFHREPIRALAVSPRGAKQALAATGTSDGKIHLWNLFPDQNGAAQNGEPRPVPLLEKPIDAHRDAVTALAFSADGGWLASGSVDGNIKLWNVADGKLIYLQRGASFDDQPHQGAVTALAFTPHARLVSASRDNTLRVWNLREKGAKLEGAPITGRSGNVHHLGVSQDGRWLLFDQGKSLQLMAAPDGQVVNTLRNPGSTTPFETLALFSPDASLILTGGAPEGRLQLWRAPSDDSRAFEVRQFVNEQRSPATCAAFAPAVEATGETAFAASGTKDGNVYLWPVPAKKDVDAHRITNVPVTLFSRSVEAGSRQIRIGVEVPNATGRLMPGRPVTIVIE
ncbi:MAG: hypothetical protein L0Y71_06535 [Gemmataceae bacterium]|nr:hypothetical protein [Gemmataceae bacterium]